MANDATGLELFLTEIKVSDWAGTVRWYVETLGMRLLLEDPDHQYAMLGAGRGRLALKGGSPPGLDRDLVRLIVQVEDLEAEQQRLIGRGVSLAPPVDNPDEGYREVRLHDPEGTPIRLFSWIPSETTQKAAARAAPLDPWRP
jgi:catechol 2,3-dioxygenase-like lactoylglutathione lyase family enzyme